MRFSQHFGLNKTQLELDFVDIDPDRDLPLFLDPYALSVRSDPWSQECADDLRSFFQTTVDAIRSNDIDRGRRLLGQLSEPNETCRGLSLGTPRGRGVGREQADDLYDTLAKSRAVATGIMNELADAELVIPGIGDDKISDITTNVIRARLIEYTQHECALHRIVLNGTVASGSMWDSVNERWTQDLVPLPIINNRKVLLVPKAVVKWRMSLSASEYYQHFVLNFLQTEEINQGSSLVQTLKSGEYRVTKESLKAKYPFTKAFLIEFTQRHPEVLRAYKQHKMGRAAESTTNRDLSIADESFLEDIDEPTLARSLIERLGEIETGTNDAYQYEQLMSGVLEFIFFPDLMNPVAQFKIHEGRKRIDITYDNAARTGVFGRALRSASVNAQLVMVECKNYDHDHDPANPELDQLAGRFSHTRGRLGLLVARKFKNRELFLKRCRDTALDGRGFIMPLADQEIAQMLDLIADDRRNEISGFLSPLYANLLT